MIDSFRGKHEFLSNFYNSPVEYEGMVFPTVEHAFQAAKTFTTEERAQLRDAPHPRDAKRLGRAVRLRPDWEKVKYDIMLELVRSKFQEPRLRKWLLGTGDVELEEGNVWHDKIWGRCHCPRCGGRGENRLGKTLMTVRAELAAETEPAR